MKIKEEDKYVIFSLVFLGLSFISLLFTVAALAWYYIKELLL